MQTHICKVYINKNKIYKYDEKCIHYKKYVSLNSVYGYTI